MARRLGIVSPSKRLSRALSDLADYVREGASARQWLELLEREHGYVIALTRLAAEKAREEREAQAQ